MNILQRIFGSPNNEFKRVSITDERRRNERVDIEVYNGREIYWFPGYHTEYSIKYGGFSGIEIGRTITEHAEGVYIIGGNNVFWIPLTTPERAKDEMNQIVMQVKLDIDYWNNENQKWLEKKNQEKSNNEKILQTLKGEIEELRQAGEP
jgi:hypothetical protein